MNSGWIVTPELLIKTTLNTIQRKLRKWIQNYATFELTYVKLNYERQLGIKWL